jgi:hypothetical protein
MKLRARGLLNPRRNASANVLLNDATGQTQRYVNLFNDGGYLLNVSVNGKPLTQLEPTRTHVPVFLAAGIDVISVARGSLATDHYIRDGGTGACVLAQ